MFTERYGFVAETVVVGRFGRHGSAICGAPINDDQTYPRGLSLIAWAFGSSDFASDVHYDCVCLLLFYINRCRRSRWLKRLKGRAER